MTKTHGLSNTKIYKCWQAIKVRCYNKNCECYNNYGGRGISMCDEWRNDFMAFYNWAIENGYKETLTIDRIDVNGIYEPKNCRWITLSEQNSNKTNNFIVRYKGEDYIINNLAKKLNVDRNTLRRRIEKGINESKWGEKADRNKICVVYKGEKFVLKELAKIKNINFQTLKNRLYAGWSIEKAIETPVNKRLSRTK